HLDPSRPIIALLPGSRHKELVRILPPMLDAASLIAKKRSEVQFVIVVAPNRKIKKQKRSRRLELPRQEIRSASFTTKPAKRLQPPTWLRWPAAPRLWKQRFSAHRW